METLGHQKREYISALPRALRALVRTDIYSRFWRPNISIAHRAECICIYNNLLTSKLSWDLMIYNLPVSFVKDLEAICTRYLKKWLGVTRSITVSVLYRKKDYFGLNLKRLTDLYKLLQVSKGYTLKNSEDPKV